VAVMLLTIFSQWFNPHYFIATYSLLTGCSFLLVITTLLLFPDIAVNLNIALESRYAKSSLEKVDKQSLLAKLHSLMEDEKFSRDEPLNCSVLAEQSGYSSHQISEMINTHFG